MKYLFNYEEHYIENLTKKDIFLLKNWLKIQKAIIKNPSEKKVVKFVYSKSCN